GIPARHVARGIQHEDGVVGNTLNQQSEQFFAFAQFRLSGPSLGQVPRDFGEADKFSLRRADRVDDDMGPELRAVLTNAPAFSLETAGTLRLRQRLSRDVLHPLGVGVEGREMSADNLIRLIALETSSAGIPTGDATVAVQHVDRVVSDRLDEEPVAAVAGL